MALQKLLRKMKIVKKGCSTSHEKKFVFGKTFPLNLGMRIYGVLRNTCVFDVEHLCFSSPCIYKW